MDIPTLSGRVKYLERQLAEVTEERDAWMVIAGWLNEDYDNRQLQVYCGSLVAREVPFNIGACSRTEAPTAQALADMLCPGWRKQ